MTGGTSPIGYLKAWHTNLYLSADADKVREALAEGEAALQLFKKQNRLNLIVSPSPSPIRALNSDVSSQTGSCKCFFLFAGASITYLYKSVYWWTFFPCSANVTR